ncbi:hypothetical protein AAFF_G00369540 [Aldrovandia affinis]|uniref:Uncharacterized protein n=1 Tax=Aldrovandia affinis TaxID=143900 RepID=A0AAD7WMS4_9TELE|nr:hypothetical protein AAFF_G00369540 [Aldrovandia affinis]
MLAFNGSDWSAEAQQEGRMRLCPSLSLLHRPGLNKAGRAGNSEWCPMVSLELEQKLVLLLIGGERQAVIQVSAVASAEEPAAAPARCEGKE